MPVPPSSEWVLLSAQSQEYADVMATIVPPEQFAVDPEWGVPVNHILVKDADGVEWRYVHLQSCFMYKYPVGHEPPQEG